MILEYILKEVAKYGRAIIKRIYGDFSSGCLKGWEENLFHFLLKPLTSLLIPNINMPRI